MSLFLEMDFKLENAANPAEFAALAYTKYEITDLAMDATCN